MIQVCMNLMNKKVKISTYLSDHKIYQIPSMQNKQEDQHWRRQLMKSGRREKCTIYNWIIYH